MLISINPEPNKTEFEKLLNSTHALLTKKFSDVKNYHELEGRNFEPIVKELMEQSAINTPFEKTIELISGQKFPDIVANHYYGVEVKTTTQDHWKTTGNSVLENTRVDSVERIYLLFAKISKRFEVKIRPYENCLAEVVVTHSPRYLIDMELEMGKTIFDKIDISYDNLRNQENPVRPILSYYKKLLKPGESFWWLDDQDIESPSNPSKLIFRMWGALTPEEREDYQLKGMAYFPEIFSNHKDKFSNFSLWLATKESVVCNNIRDNFTAGGQASISYKDINYKIPRIVKHLFNNSLRIKNILLSTDKKYLSDSWNKKVDESNVINIWIDMIGKVIKENPKIIEARINIVQMLHDRFTSN